MLNATDIQIRDPFILPHPENRMYYLYGTTDKDPWKEGTGFQAYTSTDLELWKGPYTVFDPPPGFWGDRNFWAPEVFRYNEAYYMFASFKSPKHCRGTQVLSSESPLGPFLPLINKAVTPGSRECLDGTLYIDADRNPWIVFCHEWVQVGDGSICASRLDPDLKGTRGEVLKLFNASEAPWTSSIRGNNFVTDGPFLYRTCRGDLIMFWSSFRNDSYAIGLAKSASGRIAGPWIQNREPVFEEEGGHCMLFHDFEQRAFIVYHSPNRTPHERMVFREILSVPDLIDRL